MSRRQELIDNVVDEIVPIPAQYNNDLSLNVDKMCAHVDWLISQDVKVLYLGLAASEFEFMSRAERLKVVDHVVKTINGRAILLSQPVDTGSIEEHAQEAKAMVELGADLLVVKMPNLKNDQKIFSCRFRKNGYHPDLHDDYFVDYMGQVGDVSGGYLILHDKPFYGFKYLEKIAALDSVVGIKTHEEDPFIRRTIYNTYGKDYICFDGMGKMYQFWSLVWGARARHTNWSWFDPQSDKLFTKAVKEGRHHEATTIVEREWPVVDAILSAGHHGYKVLMGLKGLPYSAVRNPGWIATPEQIQRVKEAAIEAGYIDASQATIELAPLGNE